MAQKKETRSKDGMERERRRERKTKTKGVESQAV